MANLSTMAANTSASAESLNLGNNHPLYLHPSDIPGAILSSVKLTGTENYSVWSRSMLINLRAKSKLGFVLRTTKKNDFDSSLEEQWEKCNAFVLAWIMNTVSQELLTEAFDQFAKGHSAWGPFWDHIMGYFKASLEYPNRILFLRYEELKKDPIFLTKILAEFLGQPFSLEEESEGIVEKITELCSFKKLSSLEVNKWGTYTGNIVPTFANKAFFRQGNVGDFKNHLSREMIEVLDEIIKQKLDFDLATFISQQQNRKGDQES